MLCQYSNIFGQPGVGFHNHFGTPIAVLDLGLTAVAAYWVSKKYRYKFIPTMGAFMVGAVLIHKLFCVDTALNKMLFD